MVTKHLQLQVEKGKIKKNNERSLGQLIFWVLYYSLKFNRSVYKGRDQGKWYPETWKWKQENTQLEEGWCSAAQLGSHTIFYWWHWFLN